MGESGKVYAKFARVLRGGNYQAAYLLALELPRVTLNRLITCSVRVRSARCRFASLRR
jgi:hypothetical protein